MHKVHRTLAEQVKENTDDINANWNSWQKVDDDLEELTKRVRCLEARTQPMEPPTRPIPEVILRTLLAQARLARMMLNKMDTTRIHEDDIGAFNGAFMACGTLYPALLELCHGLPPIETQEA